VRAIVCVLLVILSGSAAAEPVLRIATLAPEGSSLARVIADSARRIAARTEGRVRVRFYWSGQLGDERDMVRRMKLGSLDGATLATTGLALVAPRALHLQRPLAYRSSEEVEAALAALLPALEEEAARAGFVVLAWGEIGWVYLFTQRPPGLAGLRTWLWGDEPFVRELLTRAGARGVPLGLGEVTPSLIAGTIEAAYGPLLAALVLGWVPRVAYAVEPPLSCSIGALVVTRSAWDRLAAADQRALREVGRETARELNRIARRDEALARRTMERHGIRFVRLPPADQARLEEAARGLREGR
jgi:TRAP-type C4-dicarboxylate transport system substrate-binding protein